MENKILSYRYQACSNRRKKKLFSVRTKPLKSKYFFSKNVLAIEMKKTWIPVNKPVYLGISMLKLIDDENSLWENHKEFIKNSELILKYQQKLRSKKHNIFTEEVNNIALSINDDKR